jgi:DNA-binding CsgD family transcriptional regulator
MEQYFHQTFDTVFALPAPQPEQTNASPAGVDMETVALPQRKDTQQFPVLLDLIPFGIMLLDAFNHLLQFNQLAGLIIAEADGLKLIQNSIHATNPGCHQRLRRAVERAGTANDQCADNGAEMVTLCRSCGREPLEVLVTRLHQQLFTALSQDSPSKAILIWDPEKTPPLRHDRIRHMYQLTAAEARVTEGLVRGMAVVELAREMQVQTNTIRTHLKRIYDKTGVRRQSELVRLLTRNLLLNIP